MKILFFLVLIASHSSWGAGCLKDPVINREVENILKIPCKQFPHELEVTDIVIKDLQESIVFLEEDFVRMPQLYQIYLSGKGSGAAVSFKGSFDFPKLGHFIIEGRIGSFDVAAAKIKTGSSVRYIFPFNRHLLKQIPEARSVEFIGEPDQVFDFTDIPVTYPLIIEGGKLVRNLRYVEYDGSLELKGKPGARLEVQNLRVEGEGLTLHHVDATIERMEIQYSLELEDVTFDSDVRLYEHSSIRELRMKNTKLEVLLKEDMEEGEEPYSKKILNDAIEIKVENSQLSGLDLPSFSGAIKVFSVVNSIFQMEHLPDFPNIKVYKLSGKGVIRDESYPLRVHKNLEGLNLSGLSIKKLTIELLSPQNLQYFYFLGNNDVELTLSRKENLKKIPGYFMMVVDQEKTARKFRRLFDRKAVGFMDWLDLSPRD